ncbi:N-acetylmuramoyl-L-alanine amidase family protein [Anaerocolumna sp. MB42-C2]|uniref:N-acetylmuramoyl-L-alanine amidase family protein n=1 Tax=Anaerocolumna sp. MB42-C2 TaxID=3070997 RepID=UPI0027E1AA45|nr:N-acetylmuramoyl-L-alanine amidase [Anaerocolumna sp. MB42-C2]WMJ85910.1 N-acetylmuramoyl-L-alanine amidase [Anaerocolumna sp. MB42-C2]
MDEKLLKHMARNSLALMVLVIFLSSILSNLGQYKIFADSDQNDDIMEEKKEVKNGALINTDTGKTESADTSIRELLGDKYLIIKKPDKELYNINLEDLYMERSIRLVITDLKEDKFNGTSILRVNQGYEFDGIPDNETTDTSVPVKVEKSNTKEKSRPDAAIFNSKSNNKNILVPEVISATGKITAYGTDPSKVTSDPVKNFNISYIQDKSSALYTASIEITLDFVYAPILYQDEEYIYVDLKRPKDIYNKIVVIDAGHGGKDCGSFSQGEKYYEKDMNLSLIKDIKEILDKEDIKVYYTRTTDKTIFLNPRVNFANDVGADLFISLHCNSSESAQPYGSEVLYNEKQQGNGFESKDLAKIALEEITDVTHKVNRGLVPASEMVIVGKSKVPVALIEVAFMSNQEDLDFLLKEENKKKIAKAVHQVILRSFKELEKETE